VAAGVLSITVRHDLAPSDADHFLRIVRAKYYDNCFVFRVLKGFVAQFGLHPGWHGEKFKRPKEAPKAAPKAAPKEASKAAPNAVLEGPDSNFGRRAAGAALAHSTRGFSPVAMSNVRGTVAFAGASPTQVRCGARVGWDSQGKHAAGSLAPAAQLPCCLPAPAALASPTTGLCKHGRQLAARRRGIGRRSCLVL